tara:strand:- start:1213 stop:1497 length:285 start_codon:yes stop_codon:yes gene_type:complete
MESWIKENQVTSILIGAVILLTLMIGYQSNQINQLEELETTTVALEKQQKINYLYLEDKIGGKGIGARVDKLEQQFARHSGDIKLHSGYYTTPR